MTCGLLHRLAEREHGGAGPSLEQSVLQHLRVLLNTRQGNSALDPLYGVPDFTDLVHNFPDGLLALRRLIAQTIERYEPRLSRVSVRPTRILRDVLVLHFDVRAELPNGRPVIFDTTVSRGGHIQVA